MQITVYSFIGALLMLATGLILTGLYQKFWYPAQRWRHEKAKVTGSHGRDPRLYAGILKFLALTVLPAAGFVLGEALLRPVLG